MSASSTWTQLSWYELGTLLIQVAFLTAGVWFAKNILVIIRGFQEQIGALVKLSMVPGSRDRQADSAHARSSFGEASPYWLTPAETANAPLSEPVTSGPSWLTLAWHSMGAVSHRFGAWLQEPMGGDGGAPWRRIVRWLQTPTGTRSATN